MVDVMFEPSQCQQHMWLSRHAAELHSALARQKRGTAAIVTGCSHIDRCSRRCSLQRQPMGAGTLHHCCQHLAPCGCKGFQTPGSTSPGRRPTASHTWPSGYATTPSCTAAASAAAVAAIHRALWSETQCPAKPRR